MLRSSASLCLLFVAGLGCTAEAPSLPNSDSDVTTKADARRALAAGKRDGIDWCDWLGWYGDGTCDDFCERPDPDCTTPVDECSDDADCPGGYCAHFATCAAIGCPPPPPSQCVTPECGDGTPLRCRMVEPVCPAGQLAAIQNGCYTDCLNARTCEPAAPAEPAECTADSDCGDGEVCQPGACLHFCRPEDPGCCAPSTCQPAPAPSCPPVLCALYCEFGFKTNEEGCAICACADAPPAGECQVGGCSGQLCYDPALGGGISTCEFRPEYACYDTATCERQPDGGCGWTPTAELNACLDRHR